MASSRAKVAKRCVDGAGVGKESAGRAFCAIAESFPALLAVERSGWTLDRAAVYTVVTQRALFANIGTTLNDFSASTVAANLGANRA